MYDRLILYLGEEKEIPVEECQWELELMDNLHNKLNFNLFKEELITTARQNIVKFVKLQNLVAKCSKV